MIYQPTSDRSAGSKAFIDIVADGYQYRDEGITNKLYFDGSGYFNAITSKIDNLDSFVTQFNLPFRAADPENQEYSFSNPDERPVIGRGGSYVRVTSGIADGGIICNVNWDMSKDNYIVFVSKNGAAAKLKYRETGTQERIYTIPASSPQTVHIFDKTADGVAGAGGDPDWSAITQIELSLDAISTSIEPGMTYGVNNYKQIIGSHVQVEIPCPLNVSSERVVDTAEYLCQQTAEAITATSHSQEYTIETNKQDLYSQGVGMGTIVKLMDVYVPEIINDSNVGKIAISAGAITLAQGLLIHSVWIGNEKFTKYHSATGVPELGFHYDSTTGVMTFNTAYNGKIPAIKINNLVSWQTIEDTALQLGYVGKFRIVKKLESGKRKLYLHNKVRWMYQSTAINEDGDVDTFMVKPFVDSNKNLGSISYEKN